MLHRDIDWLNDDVLNAFFFVAVSSIILALTSRIWFHIHPEHAHIDHQRADNAPSILTVALASLHIYPTHTLAQTAPKQPIAVPDPSLAGEQKDHKNTRSKERRRRGKDPFKDLFKGSKKSKALLKAIKQFDHHHLVSPDTLPGNDTPSATSRSPSPEPPRNTSLDTTPRTTTESEDASNTTPNGDSSSASISTGNTSDHAASSQMDGIHSHPVTPDSMTAADAQPNASPVSTVIRHAIQDSSSSPRVPTDCADTRTQHPRDSLAESVSGSCAKFVRARTRLRALRIDPSVKSSLPSSTPSDSVANPLYSILSSSSSSAAPSAHGSDVAGPSTPTTSRGSLLPPPSPFPFEASCQVGQPSHQSVQAQIASMHSALEAARLREEQLCAAAEQASKELDELRWRWNEDASTWRLREAELRAQINHLMQQLQAYAAAASFQAPSNPSSGFSSPTSPHAHLSPHSQYHPLASFPLPSPIQPQNSASAPAHVRALLASAPMLTSHPPGFAAPTPGSAYSSTGFSMSPLLWSGLGLCVPNRESIHGGRRTPDSSASGSSSRGRRRRWSADNAKSASDESSLGEWEGMEDGSGEDPLEEDDDIFENNVLADAILKRPDSLRKLSGSVGRQSAIGRTRPPSHGMHGTRQGEAGERKDVLKDPALEKHTLVPPLIDALAIGMDPEMDEKR